MNTSSSSSSPSSSLEAIIVVVDVQYFLHGIVKEFGLYKNGTSVGLSYQPPYSFHHLSGDERNQCRWVTKNLHKIEWKEGIIPYNELPSALRFINSSYSTPQSHVILPLSLFDDDQSPSQSSSSSSTTNDASTLHQQQQRQFVYYAKGVEKCPVLEKIFNIPFIDLDSLGCPRADELMKVTPQPSKYEVECSSFPFRHHRKYCGGDMSNSRNKSISHCAQRNAKLYGEWVRSTFLL